MNFENINTLKKEFVYDCYVRIIEDFKDYEKVTKKEMLKKIFNFYKDYKNILDICTTKELKFLQKVLKGNYTSDYDKDKWERNTLYCKFLIDYDNNTVIVSEEIKEQILEALKNVDWNITKEKDRINEFLVSYVYIEGFVLTYNLIQLGSAILNLSVEEVENHILTNSVFRYYVYNFDKYFKEHDEEVVVSVYQDYYTYIDEIEERRKQFQIMPNKNINIEEFKEIFYNDFNLKNPKIKKFFKELEELPFFSRSALPIIKRSVLLNDDREELKNAFKKVPSLQNVNLVNFFKLLDDALDEMPSAVLNGLSLNQYKKQIQEQVEKELLNEKKYIKQHNACLNPKDAKLFYKIYFGLLEFTNKKYKINPGYKIYKKLGIDPNQIAMIVEKFWEEKDILITEFCETNPYKFKTLELEITEDFKKGIRDIFFVMEFQEEYTAVMNTSKVYMIKGINANIDEIINYKVLPHIIRTTILPFKNYLIYDSIFMALDINADNNFYNMITKEYESMMKYYHL